jgi:nucleoside-diphosphate-sugar epimerase
LGFELMAALQARGERVRGVCRSGRAEAPRGVQIVRGDASNARAVAELCDDAAVAYSAIGVEFTRWVQDWPPILASLVAGLAKTGTKLAFADNLYAYGPPSRPLDESTPYTDFGKKPALRARLARTLESSGIPVVIARASDFYGPRVRNSLLGERVFGRAIAGKPVELLGGLDQPHSFTYITDFAQALVTLAADETAYGQSWHVPTAAAETPRAIVARIEQKLKRPLGIRTLGSLKLQALGLVSPTLRELRELSYEWERPFIIDDAKFRTRYFGEPTSLEQGLATTLAWYRANDLENVRRSEAAPAARALGSTTRPDTPAPA